MPKFYISYTVEVERNSKVVEATNEEEARNTIYEMDDEELLANTEVGEVVIVEVKKVPEGS